MITKTYYKGEKVTFTAQRRCQFKYKQHRPEDQITITLGRDWDEDEGSGEGGPWGWGGYKSSLLRSLSK